MRDEKRPACSFFILPPLCLIPRAVLGAVGSLFGLAALFPAIGCHNCDLVEAELRTRENDVRALKDDLYQAEMNNAALVREISALRQGTPSLIPPEQASQIYTLKEITLGRQTGGYDEDGLPGDEALQVVLEPRDVDGHVIKAPGALHVEAMQISTEGLKLPLSAWDVAPDKLRHTWRSGLWSSGYFVILPWKNWPSSERLRVIARFQLPDGRVFETDKDVTVHLTPSEHRRALPAMPPADGPAPGVPVPIGPLPATPGPVAEPMLPVPGKIDPASGKTSANWWQAPTPNTTIQTTAAWRPKPAPSLVESVQILAPERQVYEPGQAPNP
jgi:hypothetical protein